MTNVFQICLYFLHNFDLSGSIFFWEMIGYIINSYGHELFVLAIDFICLSINTDTLWYLRKTSCWHFTRIFWCVCLVACLTTNFEIWESWTCCRRVQWLRLILTFIASACGNNLGCFWFVWSNLWCFLSRNLLRYLSCLWICNLCFIIWIKIHLNLFFGLSYFLSWV